MVGRRAFLAGAATLAASGCGRSPEEDEPGGSPQDRTATSRQGDVELLQAALAMERAEEQAYALRSDQLGLRFSAHEAEHARRLEEALRALGGEPGGLVEEVLEPIDSEARTVAFYLDMLPKVYGAELRSLVASILVTESEQLAVLRERAGSRPAPDAFVYGSQPSS